MSWLILVVSGILEAVWATALAASRGLRRPLPTAVFVLALLLSTAGLAVAMKSIPTGTAYAVWVGVGAALTAGWPILRRQEPMDPGRVLLIVALVGCVAGLRVVS